PESPSEFRRSWYVEEHIRSGVISSVLAQRHLRNSPTKGDEGPSSGGTKLNLTFITAELVPLGLSKVITFEVLCWSLNIEPTITLFRIFQTLSKQGDWFSFAKRGDPKPVYKVPASFNQNHVDQLKAHIVKLHDISEGVLVQSRFSRVWHNPMCDPVVRRSDNTIMSIYDFLCMPSLDKVTVREEPHGLDTSTLGRVTDRTTSPAPTGNTIPRASPEEIAVSRPDRKVITKADHAAKRKASTRPEISTNVAKKTRSNKKGSGVGSSGQAAGDEFEQTDDGTFDDDDQRDGSEFAMEGIESLNDIRNSKLMLSCLGSEEGYQSQFPREAVPAPDTQPLDADAGADEIASDGNVDPYYEARVGNTAGDVLERDLLPFVPGPYYIPYPYDEGSGKLYKDPKICRTALDRFHTPAETHRLRELSSVELSDRMSVLQCQLITHRSMQSADLKQQNESTVRANEEVSRITAELGVLKSRCQTAEHKLSSWDKKHRKYRNERDALVIEKAKIEEELVETKSQLEHHERQAKGIQGSIASFFQSDFTPLVRRFLKSGEFNRAFASVLNTAISVGVECGLLIDRTDEEFRELSQRVFGFIPDAKEKFDRVVAAFPDTTFPFLDKVFQNSQSSLQYIARLEPDRVAPSHQTSSATTSLRANTHVRHSTSSSGTFGHTSTLEHLKKKKKSVEKGGPSAA
ncbi:hypothetical protein Tco_0917443, partial [Tanacetum coccineum]